jgi:thiazole synthase
MMPQEYKESDDLCLYGQPFKSRLLLGTARYPSPDHIKGAVASSQTNIITVSLRRENAAIFSAIIIRT